MIPKPCPSKRSIFIVILVFISTMIFITAPIASTSIVSNVNAATKGSGYECSHIPGSGTIGQVKCCSKEGVQMYCTICDNTNPPSNCQPRTIGKDDSGGVFNPNKGGVLSQNDDSSNTGDSNTGPKIPGGDFHSNDDSSNQGGSNTVDPDKIIEGGTFNDGSGSDNSGDSSGGIDSSKINSGAVFNQ